MFAFIPLCLIQDFGKDKRGFDRFEYPRLVKRVVQHIGPGAHYVHEIFFSAPFGQDAGRERIAGDGGDDVRLDLRVSFPEYFQHPVVIVTATIQRNLPLGLGSAERFFPLRFPTRLSGNEPN